MKTNKIVLELINDDLKVEVIGNGKTLSSMIAAAMLDDPNFNELISVALMKVLTTQIGSSESNEVEDEVTELEDEFLGRLSTDTWNKVVGEA